MPAMHGDAQCGDLVRIRGERWRITRRISYDTATLIETYGCDAGNRGVRSRFLIPFEPVDRVVVSSVPRVVGPLRWRRIARRVLGDATSGWTSLRAAARARFDVIPFQLEPALSLVRGDGCRFLIADAVGLGKTVQAGLMIAELRQRQPEARAIVVCPAGLREQWHDELRSRFDLDAAVLDAAGVARSTAVLPAGFNPWLAYPLVITSIDYVKRPEVMRCLETLIWDIVVFDEAHALGGRSDRAAAASALAGRGRFVVMLTATPHSGDADAFQRMCGIGRLAEDDPLLLFCRARADVGIQGARRATLLRVRPTAAEVAMHDALRVYTERVWRHSSESDVSGAKLAMSVLARRASSSAASLARSVERRLALLTDADDTTQSQLELPFVLNGADDDAPDSQLAARGLSDVEEERDHLTRILALARDAAFAESKLGVLRRLIRRTTEQAIVFTEYRDTLEHVASALPGVAPVRLHGGLTPRERADALRQFSAGSARILLATDTASEGLNLHHRCRFVVNLELPWTPLRLEQRAGRVDRIGQARRVHALHLVAAHTSEELVLTKLAARVSRVRAAIDPVAFPSLPGLEDIAEAVLGGAPLSETACAPLDPAIRSAVLVREGHNEANRIRLARTLLVHAAGEPPAARAVITSVPRRHRRSGAARSFWIFRLLLVDEHDRSISEELLSLACAHAIDPSAVPLRRAMADARDHRLAAFVNELDIPLRTWVERERAISHSLRLTHARLSARLVQLGLFDRRHDRAAAAQSALLDEAIARSAARIEELVCHRRVRVESSDLTLAITFE